MLALVETANRLGARLEEALESHGLSLSKLNVLTYLAASRQSLALSEIAAKLNCVRSNVTQLVDRLEGDGLVRRLYDPTDRRSVRAEITPLGRQRHAEGTAAVAKIGSALPVTISEADAAALWRLAVALK